MTSLPHYTVTKANTNARILELAERELLMKVETAQMWGRFNCKINDILPDELKNDLFSKGYRVTERPVTVFGFDTKKVVTTVSWE